MIDGNVILLIGSAPDVVRCAAWPKQAFGKIVAINAVACASTYPICRAAG